MASERLADYCSYESRKPREMKRKRRKAESLLKRNTATISSLAYSGSCETLQPESCPAEMGCLCACYSEARNSVNTYEMPSEENILLHAEMASEKRNLS